MGMGFISRIECERKRRGKMRGRESGKRPQQQSKTAERKKMKSYKILRMGNNAKAAKSITSHKKISHNLRHQFVGRQCRFSTPPTHCQLAINSFRKHTFTRLSSLILQHIKRNKYQPDTMKRKEKPFQKPFLSSSLTSCRRLRFMHNSILSNYQR